MAVELIKDFYGRIIAKIETKPNGDKIVYDFYNRILGRYDKSTNTTKDFYNRVIAQGDCCGMLIGRS